MHSTPHGQDSCSVLPTVRHYSHLHAWTMLGLHVPTYTLTKYRAGTFQIIWLGLLATVPTVVDPELFAT
jgi:hypothetical protein